MSRKFHMPYAFEGQASLLIQKNRWRGCGGLFGLIALLLMFLF